MKKCFNFCFYICLLLSITFFSCDKTSSTKDENGNLSNISAVMNWDLTAYNLPSTAIVTDYSDSLLIEAPGSYLFYGSTSEGGFVTSKVVTVTCSCTSGNGGCSPSSALGQTGCMMTTCNACENKQSFHEQPTVYINDVIMIDKNDGIGFYNNISEINGKIMLPSRFYELDIIVEKLQELSDNLTPSTSTSTKIIPISIYGYVVMIEVAADIDNTSIYMSSITCRCVSGGKCPKEGKLIATWCNATNCKSCEMTSSIYEPTESTPISHTITVNSNGRIVIGNSTN